MWILLQFSVVYFTNPYIKGTAWSVDIASINSMALSPRTAPTMIRTHTQGINHPVMNRIIPVRHEADRVDMMKNKLSPRLKSSPILDGQPIRVRRRENSLPGRRRKVGRTFRMDFHRERLRNQNHGFCIICRVTRYLLKRSEIVVRLAE